MLNVSLEDDGRWMSLTGSNLISQSGKTLTRTGKPGGDGPATVQCEVMGITAGYEVE